MMIGLCYRLLVNIFSTLCWARSCLDGFVSCYTTISHSGDAIASHKEFHDCTPLGGSFRCQYMHLYSIHKIIKFPSLDKGWGFNFRWLLPPSSLDPIILILGSTSNGLICLGVWAHLSTVKRHRIVNGQQLKTKKLY